LVIDGGEMSNNSNNNLVPGFNDEKDDSLKINLEKVTGLKILFSYI